MPECKHENVILWERPRGYKCCDCGKVITPKNRINEMIPGWELQRARYEAKKEADNA